jgi:hypothetical protein
MIVQKVHDLGQKTVRKEKENRGGKVRNGGIRGREGRGVASASEMNLSETKLDKL